MAINRFEQLAWVANLDEAGVTELGRLQARARDVASFWNIDVNDAEQALYAALLGEYGTISQLTGQMPALTPLPTTTQARLVAVCREVMRVTEPMAGDFDRVHPPGDPA